MSSHNHFRHSHNHFRHSRDFFCLSIAPYVIPATERQTHVLSSVIPATSFVIPAQAGIHSLLNILMSKKYKN
jgi:hypothetical protein